MDVSDPDAAAPIGAGFEICERLAVGGDIALCQGHFVSGHLSRVNIREDEYVFVSVPSADRDSAAFCDPNAFVIVWTPQAAVEVRKRAVSMSRAAPGPARIQRPAAGLTQRFPNATLAE
jgi:hypothetical protein